MLSNVGEAGDDGVCVGLLYFDAISWYIVVYACVYIIYIVWKYSITKYFDIFYINYNILL